MCMCGYGFVSLFLHVRVLALVKLWGVILFVCICLPPGLFMALSVCVCVCVLRITYVCESVVRFFLSVSCPWQLARTDSVYFSVWVSACSCRCMSVSIDVFFLVNKVEHLNRSHRTFWDHFWCSTQPSGGTNTDEYLLHHHWVFHYHSWYLFQTIIPDLRKIL